MWLSPALPGRTHDVTARTHKIPRICARQGIPILADRVYIGAGGDWGTTAKRRPPGGELTLTEQTRVRALSTARAPVEPGMARLKPWQIIRRSRIGPNRMTVVTKAVLTLEKRHGG